MFLFRKFLLVQICKNRKHRIVSYLQGIHTLSSNSNVSVHNNESLWECFTMLINKALCYYHHHKVVLHAPTYSRRLSRPHAPQIFKVTVEVPVSQLK